MIIATRAIVRFIEEAFISRGRLARPCSTRHGRHRSSLISSTVPSTLRDATKFASNLNATTPVQSLREKYSTSVYQKNMVHSLRPASARGAYRDRHGTRGGMRWALRVAAWLGRADERLEAHVENVWSWHLDADATLVVMMIRRSRGQDSRSPGRVRIRREAIAQGMPVDRLDLW
ncbi:hypothetical protein [Bradyrhizobium sp. ORS 285]|uniref:hypothetical protein n=1 Tax=Bradyrhizobium sp. ORS 285 TaxID=115808 RepID=UPI001111ECB6|nr:hypothetical protein [Bradyrhizobium sp. ORS 285]